MFFYIKNKKKSYKLYKYSFFFFFFFEISRFRDLINIIIKKKIRVLLIFKIDPTL